MAFSLVFHRPAGLPRLLLSTLLALPLPVMASAVLSVEQLQGSASVTRGQQLSALEKGSNLQPQDLITVQEAPVTLKLSRYGRIELGPGTVLSVEQLPGSSYANELRTLLKLKQGYLHFVWQRPELVTPWPMLVQLSDFQLELASGDYHFEADKKAYKFCVAEGEATLPAAIAALPLKGPACYPLFAGYVPQAVRRSAAEFASMPDDFRIGRLPTVAAVLVKPVEAPVHYQLALREKPSVPSPVAAKSVSRATARMRARAKPKQIAVAQSHPIRPHVGHGSWILNISSVTTEPDAQRELASLRAAGYAPEIEPVEVKGQQWYRLRIVDLSSREDTERLTQEISKKLGYKTIWVSRT